LNSEERAAGIDAEGFVEMLGRDSAERLRLDEAGIRDEHVDLALLGADLRKESIEIGDLAHIGADRFGIAADDGYDLVEFTLPPARDVREGAFLDEASCGRQANAAIAAGDDRDFAFQP